MPDTAQNQARFSQPRSQAPGVGFPIAELVGIVCLSTGAMLEAAIGAHASKGQSEQDLFRRLHGTLRAEDVLLADALYRSYFQIATLQATGIDVLFEQHGARLTDFCRGHSLGQRDNLVRWKKPASRPQWMSTSAISVQSFTSWAKSANFANACRLMIALAKYDDSQRDRKVGFPRMLQRTCQQFPSKNVHC